MVVYLWEMLVTSFVRRARAPQSRTLAHMRIRLTVSLEIPIEKWVDARGCEREDVRDDIRQYFQDLIEEDEMLDEVEGKATFKEF